MTTTAKQIPNPTTEQIVTDALVMTDLSDYAGTDMGMINQATGSVLRALRAHGLLAETPTVEPVSDLIAETIRRVDGQHRMGAGALGEHIEAALRARGLLVGAPSEASQEPTEQQVREGARAIPLAYEQAVKISRDVLTAAAGVAPQEQEDAEDVVVFACGQAIPVSEFDADEPAPSPDPEPVLCGPCRRGQVGCCDGNEYVRCDRRPGGRTCGNSKPNHSVHYSNGDPSPDREKLIAGLRNDAGDYAIARGYAENSLSRDLSWDQREIRAWQAADALAVPVEVDEAKLDLEKVAEVIWARAIEKSSLGFSIFNPEGAHKIARAICEAYERGELSA